MTIKELRYKMKHIAGLLYALSTDLLEVDKTQVELIERSKTFEKVCAGYEYRLDKMRKCLNTSRLYYKRKLKKACADLEEDSFEEVREGEEE